ncbi:MAG: hypothetical protein ACXACD_22365 [Candidatus Thorarchaeota archaeon]|jgi:hypothetical protein
MEKFKVVICRVLSELRTRECRERYVLLQLRAPPPESRAPKKPDEECFGLPYGDAICGVVFGSIIIISGMAYFFNWDFSTIWETTIFPYLVILFGALIILGAIYSSSTKSKRVRY